MADSGGPSRSPSSSEPRGAFRSGVRDVLPALPANVPFGVIAGVATVGVGVDPVQAIAFAGLLFAGAAQVAAVELLGEHAPVVVVVLTALGVGNERLLAGPLAAVVAWRTESMLWTITVGMVALWTLEWLPLGV